LLGMRYQGLGLIAKLANRFAPSALHGYSVKVFEA